MNRNTFTLLAAAALLAVGVAAYFLLWPQPALAPFDPAPVPTAMPASAPTVEPMASASAPAPAASAAEPPPDPAIVLPALADADAPVKDALIGLAGKSAVLGLVQTDGFLRRLVATVDNLPRARATARLWPVNPTPGKFTVDDAGRIAPDNAGRYTPFVLFIERVDTAAAATLYRQYHPLLQQAYEELGYPGQRFHLRLLEVIDHLLATPQPARPLAVALTEVKGPIESERPWVRYEYADPQLQALSAGQKILLRMGEVNQRRLSAWLRQFRGQIAR